MPNTHVSGDGKIAVILHVKPGTNIPDHFAIKSKINDHVMVIDVFASELDQLRNRDEIVSVQISKAL